jgi:hypothetical protein
MTGKGFAVAVLLSLAVCVYGGSDAAAFTRAPVSGAIDPAVTQANVRATVCKLGYTKTVRPPKERTQSIKHQLLIEQKLPGSVKDYELDHLVPLELGGHPTSASNLWLQRWDEARKKDEQEAALRKAVCAGHLTLEQAQERIRLKWGPKP